MSERLNVKISGLYGIHGGPEMKELRERVYSMIDTHNRNPYKGAKNYNINKLRLFKDIPDGVEILIDYVEVTALRTMNIPSEIIYESIYRELPELFEE